MDCASGHHRKESYFSVIPDGGNLRVPESRDVAGSECAGSGNYVVATAVGWAAITSEVSIRRTSARYPGDLGLQIVVSTTRLNIVRRRWQTARGDDVT